ncbi:TPA: hypothetical protein KO112_002877 [Clostridioides difficile]|uniref:hypothetical protein n=1 Tax=Clostridioides difficile TaxID=1496 RepID=UPI001C1D5BA2|nr:hypothetical protein [Clostridioides difficile]HBF8743965.1 hypothetical protein [Clostridioides difficile]HBG0166452.1 hypothetical protein [Clostridioides difficile]HCQ5560231.1 hypothetical protein [Clostridioides difficile]
MDAKHINKTLKLKIEELVNLELSKGVQPQELSDNIINENYTKISLTRFLDKIQCEVEFTDTGFFDEIKSKYKYKYIYDKNFVLREIIVKKNKTEKIVWNKEEEEGKLLEEIILLMKKTMKQKEIDKFINSLSIELKSLYTKNNRFEGII